MGYRTIIARYVAKRGIAQMCLCKSKYQGGVSHHFGEVLTSLKKLSLDMGYRGDIIAVSRDMGPLSISRFNLNLTAFSGDRFSSKAGTGKHCALSLSLYEGAAHQRSTG